MVLCFLSFTLILYPVLVMVKPGALPFLWNGTISSSMLRGMFARVPRWRATNLCVLVFMCHLLS